MNADIHLLHHMALAGGGIAFVPDGGLDYETSARDSLVRILPDEVGRDRWLSIVAEDSLLEMPKLRELMVVMQRFAKSLVG